MSAIVAALPAIASAASTLFGRRGGVSARKQMQFQREVLQNQIQWRVADAQAAGIHPLAALGISPSSGMPVGEIAGTDTFESMGQDLTRAIQAMMDSRERAANDVLQKEQMYRDSAVARAEIDRIRAEADLARARADEIRFPHIRSPQRDQLPPVRPNAGSDGGTLAGPELAPIPAQPVIASSGNSARDPGSINSYSYWRNDDGSMSVVPSYDAQQRMEDNLPVMVDWFARNRLSPESVIRGLRPPSTRDYPLPQGQHWVWDMAGQVFRAAPSDVQYYRPGFPGQPHTSRAVRGRTARKDFGNRTNPRRRR